MIFGNVLFILTILQKQLHQALKNRPITGLAPFIAGLGKISQFVVLILLNDPQKAAAIANKKNRMKTLLF
ncbi:MAG: hypothetical protein V2B15_11965 [Bacteroidota bacterium]